MKIKNKRNYLKEKGITLIALVVTIVVLLILAGVSVNALFGNSGIIEKAKEAQNAMDKAKENDKKGINELTNWLDNQVNGTTGGNETGGNTTGGDDNPSTMPKISRLIGTVVDKNTKAEDAYGNKITIPKGFKILPHGTTAGSATYTYSGDNIPAVQDGIVIENGTDGNQFVWVPVGTINNKTADSRGTTSTITLGRYSDFTMTNGAVASGQPIQVASVKNCTQKVTIENDYQELSTSREGNSAKDSTAKNATARDLKTFIETSLANGGYYIARYEASKNTMTNKIESQYDKTVLTSITQPEAATLAREMYGEIKENNELVYASDLVNSYAWDTAIIFIQTYGTGTDANHYSGQNKSTLFANTGINNDKYCNICDMSGNADEWTTEYSTYSNNRYFYPCVSRGGVYLTGKGVALSCTSGHGNNVTTDSLSTSGLRPLLYAK
jgi:type II secretory pathway pseudopilin PulG